MTGVVGQIPVNVPQVIDQSGTVSLDHLHQHGSLHHHRLHEGEMVSFWSSCFAINPVTFDPSNETQSVTDVSGVLITETSQGSLDGTKKLDKTDDLNFSGPSSSS